MNLRKNPYNYYILVTVINNLYYYLKVYTVLIFTVIGISPYIMTIVISLCSLASFLASFVYELVMKEKYFNYYVKDQLPFRLAAQLGKLESIVLILLFVTCFIRSIGFMIVFILLHNFISTLKSIEIDNSFFKLADTEETLNKVFNYKQRVFEIGYSLGILFIGMLTTWVDISFAILIAFFLCIIHSLLLNRLVKIFPIKQIGSISYHTLESGNKEKVCHKHYFMPVMTIMLIETFLYGEDGLSSFIYTLNTLNPEMMFGLQNGCMLIFSLVMLKIAEKYFTVRCSIFLGMTAGLLSYILITTVPINIYHLFLYSILTGIFSIAYANFGPYLKIQCTDLSDERIANKKALIENISGFISPYVLLGMYTINESIFHVWIISYYLLTLVLFKKE